MRSLHADLVLFGLCNVYSLRNAGDINVVIVIPSADPVEHVFNTRFTVSICKRESRYR